MLMMRADDADDTDDAEEDADDADIADDAMPMMPMMPMMPTIDAEDDDGPSASTLPHGAARDDANGVDDHMTRSQWPKL